MERKQKKRKEEYEKRRKGKKKKRRKGKQTFEKKVILCSPLYIVPKKNYFQFEEGRKNFSFCQIR